VAKASICALLAALALQVPAAAQQPSVHDGAAVPQVIRAQLVPRAFDPSQAIDWIPAWSVTQQARKLVPFAYVFAGAPQPDAERVCAWDSNGCAAGNCLEEAILQGVFELVERDATAIWWYNRIRRPGIALESFDQPYFLEVREHYAQAGHELWLLDLTHDLGIPVVIVILVGGPASANAGVAGSATAKAAPNTEAAT